MRDGVRDYCKQRLGMTETIERNVEQARDVFED